MLLRGVVVSTIEESLDILNIELISILEGIHIELISIREVLEARGT